MPKKETAVEVKPIPEEKISDTVRRDFEFLLTENAVHSLKPAAPGAVRISPLQLLQWIPLLEKILTSFASGTGTFSTSSPWGRRYVRIQSEPFTD